jgi:hypothetical protein
MKKLLENLDLIRNYKQSKNIKPAHFRKNVIVNPSKLHG